jgi:hypothetical protein
MLGEVALNVCHFMLLLFSIFRVRQHPRTFAASETFCITGNLPNQHAVFPEGLTLHATEDALTCQSVTSKCLLASGPSSRPIMRITPSLVFWTVEFCLAFIKTAGLLCQLASKNAEQSLGEPLSVFQACGKSV